MAVPGSNLLNTALRSIASQTVAYHQFVRRNENESGLDVPVYAPVQALKGSLQAVPRTLYQPLGLDFNRNYVYFYVSKQILDIERNVSGDQLSFMGKRYQVQSATDWVGIDGWTAVLCAQISSNEICPC